MTFNDLGLATSLVKAVTEKGYTTPSPIQKKAIPVVLQGKDVLASAQTGTGKTAGFTLPMLQILSQGQLLRNRPIRALVLTPTRELAAQVHDNVVEYSAHLDIKSTVIFGGVKQNPQVATLRKGVDILVATPGRLLDLISQKYISLSKVEILVLDEADRMLDMGFLRDIKKVLALVPRKKQSLLFSATFSKDIKQLANSFLNNPVLVEAEPQNSTAEKVIQKAYRVDAARKTELVVDLITDGIWQQVLIFTRTKHGANRLAEKLNKNGISAAAIHGNKSQAARTKALAGFKKNDIRVLVATDIAARGLDIPLLPHVINFELPNVAEDYVHRIGRTGRAGASGEALSLVSKSEIEYAQAIEKLLGHKLETEIIKGYEPTANDPADKPKQGGQRRNFSRPKQQGANRPSNRNNGGGNNWSRNKSPRKPGSSSRTGDNRRSR